MSDDRTNIDYVQDIVDELHRILKFTKKKSYESFSKDDKTIYAVIRSFEIIGEAAKKIPQNITGEFPDIPWKRMSGMRDKLIHEYFGVDIKTLWKTIQKRVPETIPLAEKLLQELERKDD